MLSLTRSVGERLLLAGDGLPGIVVQVIRVAGDRVGLAIQAPPEVQIAREEIAYLFGPEIRALAGIAEPEATEGSRRWAS